MLESRPGNNFCLVTHTQISHEDVQQTGTEGDEDRHWAKEDKFSHRCSRSSNLASNTQRKTSGVEFALSNQSRSQEWDLARRRINTTTTEEDIFQLVKKGTESGSADDSFDDPRLPVIHSLIRRLLLMPPAANPGAVKPIHFQGPFLAKRDASGGGGTSSLAASEAEDGELMDSSELS